MAIQAMQQHSYTVSFLMVNRVTCRNIMDGSRAQAGPVKWKGGAAARQEPLAQA